MNKYAMNWTDFILSQAILISNVSAFICTQNIFVLWLWILHILHFYVLISILTLVIMTLLRKTDFQTTQMEE
jgi:hypothetical protein